MGSDSTGRMRSQVAEFHDREEVRRAVRALGRVDLERLSTAAKTLLGGLQIDPPWRDHDDLLSSAIARTLSGERRWNKGVDFARHLFQTMRSTAGHWRRRAVDEDRWLVMASREPSAEDPKAEAALVTRGTIEYVGRSFAGDKAARQVISCWALGLTGPEIRRRTGMSQRELQTTVQRIRRFARRDYGRDIEYEETLERLEQHVS